MWTRPVRCEVTFVDIDVIDVQITSVRSALKRFRQAPLAYRG